MNPLYEMFLVTKGLYSKGKLSELHFVKCDMYTTDVEDMSQLVITGHSLGSLATCL